MPGVEDLLLAIGLALDACAVCIARGVSRGVAPRREPLVLALTFGLFQAGMPLLGGLVGEGLGSRVASWGSWLACGILVVLGSRMVWAARRGAAPIDGQLTVVAILALAVATSIDALAAGFGIALIGRAVPTTAATIGVVTFVLARIGYAVGRRLGGHLGGGAQVAGGLILIGIGLQVLVSHLTGT